MQNERFEKFEQDEDNFYTQQNNMLTMSKLKFENCDLKISNENLIKDLTSKNRDIVNLEKA